MTAIRHLQRDPFLTTRDRYVNDLMEAAAMLYGSHVTRVWSDSHSARGTRYQSHRYTTRSDMSGCSNMGQLSIKRSR